MSDSMRIVVSIEERFKVIMLQIRQKQFKSAMTNDPYQKQTQRMQKDNEKDIMNNIIYFRIFMFLIDEK